MADTQVVLDCKPFGAAPVVIAASGVEAMNRLDRWVLEVVTHDAAVDVAAAIGATATLTLVDEGEGASRAIGLVIVDVVDRGYGIGHGRNGHQYVVSLAPPPWLLTLRSGYRVFLGKTTREIVDSIMKDAGLAPDSIVWRLHGTYMQRLQCVQYGETDWAFVERLLADEGIAYWLDFDDAKGPQTVFGDAPESHDGIAAPHLVPFDLESAGRTSARSFVSLEASTQIVPQSVQVRDYDVRQPGVYIEGKAGAGTREHFEFPASVLNNDAAGVRAKVRLDQLQRLEAEAEGTSDCARIQPGRLLDVDGAQDPLFDRRYLVIEVRHEVRIAFTQGEHAAPYLNQVKMIPKGRFTLRPELPLATRPRVSGVEVAVTTGPAGEEIHVDDLGRVKLRFPWDRSGISDDKSSEWTRSLQMGMGGSMLLPRTGWEVTLAYLDGDPDAPFVLGRVYNATAVVPYALPAGKATTTLQSATSPGGGSTNEIRMGDSGGKMEMFIHASKDHSVNVGGSAKTTVGANLTHDVALSHSTFVTGAQTHSVGANQTVNVATDHGTEVKGGRSESIGGMENLGIKANRQLLIKGAYAELVGAAYILQCNQANYDVKGAHTQLIGGSYNHTSGLGTGENVAGARTELVGGGRSILSAKGVSDQTTGVKSVTAGATSEDAGTKISTAVKAAGSILIGGSASMKAGGIFAIDAAKIDIDVSGSLTAGAFEISGGTLKATKGTTKFKGKVKRTGGTDIE